MAEVARLEGRVAIDGIRSAQGDLRAFDSAMRDSARSADKAADGIEKSGSRIGSALSGIAKGAAVASAALGAGLAAGLAGSIKVAADFQQSLANVGSATGATAEQMTAMRREALKIGADTSKSASEAVSAMGELVKAGMDVETVIGGAARSTVQLAEATGIDMVEAATLTSNAMNTFKAQGLDAATAAETFAKAANASAIDVSDLGQSLSAVGAVWATSGQNMQDFATAVGILGNNAIRGSDAGTSLKAMLAGLTPNSKEAASAMRNLGINAFNADGSFKSFRDIVANLQQAFGPLNEQQRATYGELIFGSDAVRSLNVLLKEGTAGWDAFQESMTQAPSLADQSAQRMNTLNGQIEMLKGSLETIAIEVGSLFLPALTQVAGFLAQNIGPAFDALRARLSGLWANVGPEAAAAGAAIVSGLTAASTWITSTFLPAAQRVAGDIWAEVSPKAQAAAQDIITALGEVKSWIESNWPAVREALGGVFDRLAETAGPAIEEVKRRLSELEQRMNETDKGQRELFRDGSAFDRLAGFISDIDFSPITSQFAPLKREAAAWSSFLGQDFGPAMAGARDALGFVKQAIMDQIPDWANLGNAATAGGALVVAAVHTAVSVAEHGSAGIRAALQLVIDLLERDWGGAFSSAVSAVTNLATALPPVAAAAEGVRAVLDLLGRAASAAAGFIGGLAGGLGSLAGTASSVVGPLQGVLGMLDKIGAAKGALDFVLPGSLPPLAQGVHDVGEQASEAAGGMSEFRSAAGDWITVGSRVMNTTRQNEQAIARLAVEIARLNEQLKYVEPQSERAEAIQNEINLLQAWQGQIQAGTAVLKAEADALEASKTALDGATEARSKFLQQQSDISRFGTGGADVMGGVLTALTEGTAQSGRDAYAGLEKFIDGLKERLGPRAQEAGNYLRFLFFETLSATGEDREAALGRFGQFFTDLQAEQQQAMIVSAQSMNSALTTALFDEATKASLGEKAAGLRTAIAQMLDVSGTPEAAQAQANVATMVAGLEAEIRKLPASVQGPILAEYQAAMRAFADAPNDAGVRENLERVVSEAERMLAFIPKNLDKLAPEMRAAAMNLWEQVKSGLLSAEEASERFQQALSLIPQGIAEMTPQLRSEIQSIIDGFVALGGSAEGAGSAIEMAMQRAADAAAAAADEIARTATEGNMLGLPTAHAGKGGGSSTGLGSIEGPAANFNEMMSRAMAGDASPQAMAAQAQYRQMIEAAAREEQERLATEQRQRDYLRELTLSVGQRGRSDEANAILTDLSAGFISIDEAIRELLELLRRREQAGQKTTIAIDGREFATVTAPYISSEITASVQGTAGGGYG